MSILRDTPSKMQKSDWEQHGYPLVPNVAYTPQSGRGTYVPVSDGHKLYAQEYGNPKGEPVIVLHGGPGGGCNEVYARYFDPKRFRIILFDQRGCGHSTPTTHQNLAAAMQGNNTATLAEDINSIRAAFNIKGKAHIEGGSWGSTLALYYAEKYPQLVKSLILRGIFLGNPEGIKFLFQGNANTYEPTAAPLSKESTEAEKTAFLKHFYEQKHDIEGAYRAYAGYGQEEGQIPAEKRDGHQHMTLAYATAWDEYVRQIPQQERGDMIQAYDARLQAKADEALRGTGIYDPQQHRIDPAYQLRMAFAFSKWEGAISNFSHEVGEDGAIDLGKFQEDPAFAVDFARLEARYMRDGLYLSDKPEATPGGNDYLIQHLDALAKHNIPMLTVHGMQDEVCPVREAFRLTDAYKAALDKHGIPAAEQQVELITPDRTGHSRLERGTTLGLIKTINERAPRMTLAEQHGEFSPAARGDINGSGGPRSL